MGIIFFLSLQCLIVLWGIASIKRAHRHYLSAYKASWLIEISGLLLILAGNAGLFLSSWWGPSLAGNFFCMTAGVVGIVLFLIGQNRILFPAAEAVQERDVLLKKLAFLAELDRKDKSDPSLEDYLKESLEGLSQNTNYAGGAIYSRSIRFKEMVLSASYGMESAKISSRITKPGWLSLYQMGEKMELEGSKNYVPKILKHERKIVGLALLRQESAGRLLPDLDRLSLEIWARGVAAAINSSRRRKLKSEQKKAESAGGEISELLSQEEHSLENQFPKLARIIQNLAEYDRFSLAVMESGGKSLDCYTVGTAGNVLCEKGISPHAARGPIARAIQGKGGIIPGTPAGEWTWFSEFDNREEYRSTLAIPLKSSQQILGVILIEHKEPNRYRLLEARRLRQIVNPLASYLTSRHLRQKLQKLEALMKLLEKIVPEPSPDESLIEQLSGVAKLVSTSLPVTTCRVSLLENGKENLRTISEHSLRSGRIPADEGESISLSHLPWHRLTLSSKRAMLVNQSDLESLMPESEIREAFHRPINSAILVPLLQGNNPVGLLSLIEERDWDRRPLTDPEMWAASLVAGRLGELLDSYRREPSESAMPDEMGWKSQISSEQMRRQLCDPLSGILGAAELLNLKHSLTEDEKRYVQMILRMAQKIGNSLKESSEGEAEWAIASTDEGGAA